MTSSSVLQCQSRVAAVTDMYSSTSVSHHLHSDDTSPPSLSTTLSANRRSSSSSTSTSTLSVVPPEDPVLSPPATDSVAHRLTFKTNPSLLEPPSKDRRLSRCESEKLRRDRLNAYIGELAKIVPLVMQSNRKIDKASVLRLTVTYLRIYHDIIGGSRRKKSNSNISWPSNTSMGDLANLLLDSFNGFLLVVNTKGVIIFVTETITAHLGHNLADVLGCELFSVVHPDDHELLRSQLNMSASDLLIEDVEDDGDVNHTPVRGQRSFCVRMQNVKDSQTTAYNSVHIVGHLRRMPRSPDGASSKVTQGNHRSGVCLIGVARLEQEKPISELYPVLNDSPQQWITRHELDGKITYSDQRGACLTGFLPGESNGLSAYSLVHPEDIPYVVAMHNYFFVTGEKQQTIFRTYTKSRDILYISNTTHLVVDMWTKKAKFIISINDVLSDSEGREKLRAHRLKVRGLTAGEVSLSLTPSEIVDVENTPHFAKSQPVSNGSVVLPKVKVDDSTVNVIVGNQQFVVDMAKEQTFGSHDAEGQSSWVYDPHTSAEDGGRSIPLIEPVFMGSHHSGSETSCDLSDETFLESDGSSNFCVFRDEFHSQETCRSESVAVSCSSMHQLREVESVSKSLSPSGNGCNHELLRQLLRSQGAATHSHSVHGNSQQLSSVKTSQTNLKSPVLQRNCEVDVCHRANTNGDKSTYSHSISSVPVANCAVSNRENVIQNSIFGLSSSRPVSISKHPVPTHFGLGDYEKPKTRCDPYGSTGKRNIGILPQSVNSREMLSQTMYHNGLTNPQSLLDRYIRMKDDGRTDNLSWQSNEDVWTFRNHASFTLIPETANGFVQTAAPVIEPCLINSSSSSDSVNLSSSLYDFNPHDTSIFDVLNI